MTERSKLQQQLDDEKKVSQSALQQMENERKALSQVGESTSVCVFLILPVPMLCH